MAPPDEEQHRMDKEWYDSIVRQIEREDELVNQRLTWLMQFEGLMFAGLGLVSRPDAEYLTQTVMIVFPVMGFLVALSAMGAIRDARKTASQLKQEYEKWEKKNGRKWAKPFGGPASEYGWAFLLDYSRALPLLMVLAWTYISYRNYGYLHPSR
jgi:hypothetical protein